MKLYLVQHAKAVSAQQDPARPLSEEGRHEIQKVAVFIKSLNLCVDYLWHSDKLRAVQTAQLLAEAIRIENTAVERDGLGPNDDVTVIRDELLSTPQDIMIVGHLPFLAKLASLLLIGDESTNPVAFKNVGIICLTCSEESQWQIDWIIIPQLFI